MPNSYGRQVVIPLTNKSGGGVVAGDVVIIDTSNDEAFTTTTTGRAEVSVGVAQETIANNASGRVLVEGYAALLNVPSSVTRGHYIETHTVAKQVAGSSTRRSGSCGQFFKGGTTPSGWLWGSTDQTASGGSDTNGLVLLEQHTASSSASLDFTSFISSTYDTYQFQFLNLIPATNNVDFYAQVGTGGGPTYDTAGNYSNTIFAYSKTGTASAGGVTTSVKARNSADIDSNASGGGVTGFGYLWYPQATTFRRIMLDLSYIDGDPIGSKVVTEYIGGTALTAIKFYFSSGNITSGTIRAYGIVKS